MTPDILQAWSARVCAAACCLAALAALPAHAGDPAAFDPLHAWIAGDDPAALASWVDYHLAAARRDLARIRAVRGPHTLANTVRPFDDAANELAIASFQTSNLFAVGASAALRDAAQAQTQRVAAAQTDLNLDPAVYRALVAVPVPRHDPDTAWLLKRSLLEYRLAGVDRSAAVRAKVHILQDRITALGLEFNRNIQDGMLSITATREELAGLPEDYIARHQPDAEGHYTLTTDAPDSNPVMDYAEDAGLRRRMFIAYSSRAWPANRKVLLDLLGARAELAKLLGYPRFADYDTADQMIGNAAQVRQLIAEVDQASREPMRREFADLLAFARQRDPSITGFAEPDVRYWMEQYRRARFDFDARSARPYFPYDQVEQGILDSASRIFAVEFHKVADARVWHPAVTTYDVFDHGRRVGRIYLDMHPREGKDKWFSSNGVVPGIGGRQLPEGILICNFSGGVAGDPGLMQHDEVVTFFHEFGHLMHHILGSQHRWASQGGFNVEGDFIEAPSQMLEEFFSSHAVLAGFAHHYQDGSVIPAELVARMNAADAFGRGRWLQRQLVFSSLSLELHDRDPASIDPDAVQLETRTRFSPVTQLPEDHFYASFGHLTGYASRYYTYVLDKVIALDFFDRFDRAHPFDGPMPARYRRTVIDPGSTRPAAQLVRDFLGRPQDMRAITSWMNQENRAP